MSEPTIGQVFAVRTLIGQFMPDGTDADRLPDDAVKFFWAEDEGGSVLQTAILVAEALAATGADSFQWTADGQTMDVSKIMGNWQMVADTLRRRLAGRTTGVAFGRAAAVSVTDEWS